MSTLLLDKSAFQALNPDDLRLARDVYQILATDVLLLEVVGDIRHKDGRSESFARKLRMADAVVNMPCHEIAGSELLGEHVPMIRRPLLKATPVRNARGEVGAFVPPSQGDEALLRWSRGEFDDSDLKIAEEWVSASKSFDLGFFERGVRAAVPAGQGPHSLEHLANLIESALREPDLQSSFIEAFLAYLPAPTEIKQQIEARWRRSLPLLLWKDAPYTCHCLKVLFVLFGGVGGRLIGTRSTNFVDAHYLMYLPFCSYFASRDKVHRALFPLFAQAGQELFTPEDLRMRLGSAKASGECG